MQEKKKQKEIEERKRQESLVQRQRILREKVMSDCKQMIKKKESKSGPINENNQLLQMQKSKTITLDDEKEHYKGIIEQTRLERRKLIDFNLSKFHEELDEDNNDENKAQESFKLNSFKRMGSKTASNMKEITGIGLSKIVAYEDQFSPIKPKRLPSITPKTNPRVPTDTSMDRTGDKTPSNLKVIQETFQARNRSTNKIKKLDPFQSLTIQETTEDRTTVSLSIVKKNIENVAKLPKNYAFVTNVTEWIKKNRLDPSAKIFIVSPAYPDIKEALEIRGWIENPDYDSSCYHLKFSLRGKDINYNLLENYQVVNHFGKATNITTKSGLCKSIKNMIWSCNEDCDAYFPKCYDTVDDGEYEAFISYYKTLKAESILKEYMSLLENGKIKMLRERGNLIEIAVRVALKRLMDIDSIIDCKGVWSEVSPNEWEILGASEKVQEKERDFSIDTGSRIKRSIPNKSIQLRRGLSEVNKSIQLPSKSMEFNASMLQEADCIVESAEYSLGSQEEVTITIKNLLNKLEEKFPQTSLNGLRNIWIVKPAGLSRGRGIKLFDNMAEIHNYSKGKDTTWVIQKYIENPLLFKGKKLDIRQWVMVTDWNPLVVWFYQECYIRLSTSDYDLSDISNRFSHLTNNSINKHAKNFEKEASFLGQTEFAEYLKGLNCSEYSDPFYQKIQPRMKEIVRNTLMCVQDMVENRKNSSEIYGYDFCIDDKLNTWLIEINASPAWDYSSVDRFNLECH